MYKFQITKGKYDTERKVSVSIYREPPFSVRLNGKSE